MAEAANDVSVVGFAIGCVCVFARVVKLASSSVLNCCSSRRAVFAWSCWYTVDCMQALMQPQQRSRHVQQSRYQALWLGAANWCEAHHRQA